MIMFILYFTFLLPIIIIPVFFFALHETTGKIDKHVKKKKYQLQMVIRQFAI